MTIPSIPFVKEQVRPLNSRLWDLVEKAAKKTITPAESRELDVMCQALETEQDGLVEFERISPTQVML